MTKLFILALIITCAAPMLTACSKANRESDLAYERDRTYTTETRNAEPVYRRAQTK